MDSVPHFYSDYQFSPEEFSDITSVIAQENYGATFANTSTMLGHPQNLRSLHENNGGLDCFQVESDILSRVPMTTTPCNGKLGVSQVVVPSLMDYGKMDFNGIAKIQNLGGGFQYSTCEYGEDCCGFPQNGKFVCPDSGENWRTQCNQMSSMEPSKTKVGRYTAEERKDRILRYLKKRNQRNFNKTIKYACRKTLADRRVRVRGRFARKNELCEEENVGKKSENPLQEKESYRNDALEKEKEDGDWLQEALASLTYVPHIA